MNELQVKGTQSFLGKEIPVIEGGFGENQKVMLAKTIAEIHETRLLDVNAKINEHLDEFEIGVDLLDLKNSNENLVPLLNGIYTKQSIANSKNIYLLSEQGYMLLVGFMKTEKAKEIRKQLRREYFAMREVINSNEQLKAKLLLEIYNGGQEGIIATRELVELEKKPLLETIETQKPKVKYHDKVLNGDKLVTTTDIAKDLGMTARQLHNKLHDMKIIFKTGNHWTFYAKYQTRIPLYADYQIGEHGQILKWTEKGRKWIIKLLNEQKEKDGDEIANNLELNEDDLVNQNK